ncbi:MAG: DUF4159 domain-containing protein [Bacteroidales bacterium]|nr:DUF4159 domain-containing protein [Bacteroidales bacterium]
MRKILLAGILFYFACMPSAPAQEKLRIALLKYSGGGDWYANPTSLPNLIAFCNNNLGTNIDPVPATVEPGDPAIFSFPFVHMTGHGNVIFNENEIQNLVKYFEAGGFLHIDDNYGMDPFIRRELAKLFPGQDFKEITPSHPIFNQKFKFPNGLPKIHEHDGKPPQAFAFYLNGRMVCLYTYECDLGDGWEDPRVHGDSEETRQKALKMGANIIQFVFNGAQ